MIRSEKMEFSYTTNGETWYRRWSIDPETGIPRCNEDALPASELDAGEISALEDAFSAALDTATAIEDLEGARRLVADGEPAPEVTVTADDGIVSKITNPDWTAWSQASVEVASADTEITALADKRTGGD